MDKSRPEANKINTTTTTSVSVSNANASVHPSHSPVSATPVSSLRSHFEAFQLKPQPPPPAPKPKNDALRGISLATSATTLTSTTASGISTNPPSTTPTTPTTTTTTTTPTPTPTPTTGAATPDPTKRRSTSPSKHVFHRRHLSLTTTPVTATTTPLVPPPSFRVDSPSSPPRQAQGRQAGESDREREREQTIDTTPFAKVRELISQHSGRNVSPSPRSPSPSVSAPVSVSASVSASASGSPSPSLFPRQDNKPAPPVNRSDKPKIAVPLLPGKKLPPPSLASLNHASTLLPEVPTPTPSAGGGGGASRASSDAQRISPFSTPPSSSSDGSPSPSSSPAQQAHPIRPTAGDTGDTTSASASASTNSKSKNDPRFMGFQRSAQPTDRRDPRAMGFSPSPSPAAALAAAPPPARASTVSERPADREGRTVEHRPQQRHVSDNLTSRSRSPALTTTLPSHSHHHSLHQSTHQPHQPHQPPTHSVKIGASRDPRTMGFVTSAAAAAAAATEEHGSPPRPRRATIRAPPRAVDPAINPPAPRRIIRQPSPIPPDRSTKPAPSPSQTSTSSVVKTQLPTTQQQRISKAPIPPSDIQFLPPPKRNIGGDSDKSVLNPTPAPAPATAAPTAAPTAPPISAATVVPPDRHSDDPEHVPAHKSEYPDASHSNRRPPHFRQGLPGLQVRAETRAFDVCGNYLCVTGLMTKVYDLSTGDQLSGINHGGDTIRASAIRFKPAADVADEGKRIWVGNNAGDLQEFDVATHTLVAENSSHNRCEVIRILRHRRDLWTLDIEGKLFVWRADESGTPNLKYSHITHRVPKGHTFSLVVRDTLWLATGKDLRLYRPGSEANFAPLTKVLSQPGTGDITSGTTTATTDDSSAERVYFGHNDGRVTIYSTKDYSCVANVKASDYKINGLAISGNSLWAAYKTGKIYVYDVTTTPWRVQKDWRAHEGPIIGLTLDPKSIWTMQRMQITSIGHDGHARFWDGLLEEDWIEHQMQDREALYCSFRQVRAAVVTWNCGACTPYELRTDFISAAMHASSSHLQQQDPPEILAFGFQEVVDLEDRAVTAKSIFGFGKKKDVDSTEQYQSRVYRDWRDYLSKQITRAVGNAYSYTELHTSSLIGLFQCIFIRQEERGRLRNVQATNIKCGMKGHYGNKGGLVTRFILDDTSLCFINCHLAAGQTQTSHRNNDLAIILESENLGPEPDRDERIKLFTGGGDGSQILDHEICILNGDLNYRIDTVPRDTVIKMIKANDLAKLLERDQLMLSRRRPHVSGFRLSAFVEMPIKFAPTYKYDVGTDNYDTSEKKRAPAWCDRILYRGGGARGPQQQQQQPLIQQVEYRRHDDEGVRVSDHRPVSGLFKIRLKTVDRARRAKVLQQCQAEFDAYMKTRMQAVAENWLVFEYGMARREAARALQA